MSRMKVEKYGLDNTSEPLPLVDGELYLDVPEGMFAEALFISSDDKEGVVVLADIVGARKDTIKALKAAIKYLKVAHLG